MNKYHCIKFCTKQGNGSHEARKWDEEQLNEGVDGTHKMWGLTLSHSESRDSGPPGFSIKYFRMFASGKIPPDIQRHANEHTLALSSIEAQHVRHNALLVRN